jgi:hypothetical protein
MAKQRVNIALSPAGHAQLARLAAWLGINRTATIELAIRRMTAAEGVPDEPAAPPSKPKPAPPRKRKAAGK